MTNNYTFFTNHTSFNVETKDDGEKEYYVTGYISTSDRDLVNDVVTKACMEDMLTQIKSGSIKLDIEHEAYRPKDGNPNKIPVAKIVDAKIDSKGLYVKAVLNKFSPSFKSIWGSIKNKFLDAFSITYKALDTVDQVVNGVKVRLLNKIMLLNVAITGNPVNPSATMDKVFMKSLEANMMEQDLNAQISELKSKIEILEKENTQLKACGSKEAKADSMESEEDKKKKEEMQKEEEAKKTEAKNLENKEIAEIKSKIDLLEKENKELKSFLEQPQFKSVVVKEQPAVVETKSKVDLSKVSIFDLIN